MANIYQIEEQLLRYVSYEFFEYLYRKYGSTWRIRNIYIFFFQFFKIMFLDVIVMLIDVYIFSHNFRSFYFVVIVLFRGLYLFK